MYVYVSTRVSWVGSGGYVCVSLVYFGLIVLDLTCLVLIIIIIAFGSNCCIGRLQELSRHPDPGSASQVIHRCNPSSLFQPPDRGAKCFSGLPGFLSLRVPGQGLTCSAGHWFSEGVSSPSSASLEDLIFCWLFGPFPELSVVEGLRPSDPKKSFKAVVD